MTINTLFKNIFVVSFLTIFLVGIFGIYTMDMSMGSGHMTMVKCPFSPGSSLCTMTPFEHITATQSLFSALPHDANALVLVIVFVSGLIFCATLFPELFSHSTFLYMRRSVAERPYLLLHGTLQPAFSNGILNSKAF